jgi:hypothetical protein
LGPLNRFSFLLPDEKGALSAGQAGCKKKKAPGSLRTPFLKPIRVDQLE